MSRAEIWTFGDLRTAQQWRASQKVLVKALTLAKAADTAVSMILIGAPAGTPAAATTDPSACIALRSRRGQAAAIGAQTVYCLTHPLLAAPRADLYARVLADFVQQRKPWLIFLPLNDFGRETAAIGAQRCQAGLIADCVAPAHGERPLRGPLPGLGRPDPGRHRAGRRLAHGLRHRAAPRRAGCRSIPAPWAASKPSLYPASPCPTA